MEWAATLLADASRPVEVRTAAHTILALIRLASGRLAEARESMAVAESLDPLRGGELRALVATFPFLPSDPAALAAAPGALERGEQALDESFFLPDHDGVRPLLRAYLSGLLGAELGARDDALRRAAELERLAAPAADPTLARDLALGVRAEVLRREGRSREALEALVRIEEPPGYELVLPSPFQRRARERYLRAVLLDELGRRDEALGSYAAIGNRSFYDLPYRAPAYLRLAGLHEGAGRRQEAIGHYRRFVELWRRADPELQAQVTEARRRIAALRGESSTN
jgi:tetratricopeptide (TPR) repeat protein